MMVRNKCSDVDREPSLLLIRCSFQIRQRSGRLGGRSLDQGEEGGGSKIPRISSQNGPVSVLGPVIIVLHNLSDDVNGLPVLGLLGH